MSIPSSRLGSASLRVAMPSSITTWACATGAPRLRPAASRTLATLASAPAPGTRWMNDGNRIASSPWRGLRAARAQAWPGLRRWLRLHRRLQEQQLAWAQQATPRASEPPVMLEMPLAWRQRAASLPRRGPATSACWAQKRAPPTAVPRELEQLGCSWRVHPACRQPAHPPLVSRPEPHLPAEGHRPLRHPGLPRPHRRPWRHRHRAWVVTRALAEWAERPWRGPCGSHPARASWLG